MSLGVEGLSGLKNFAAKINYGHVATAASATAGAGALAGGIALLSQAGPKNNSNGFEKFSDVMAGLGAMPIAGAAAWGAYKAHRNNQLIDAGVRSAVTGLRTATQHASASGTSLGIGQKITAMLEGIAQVVRSAPRV